MMKLKLAAATITTVAVLAAIPTSGASETKTVCHQGTTIEVPHSLVWQHIDEQGNPQPGHNDYFGTCRTTPTTPPPPTTTVPDTTTTTVPDVPPTIPPPVVCSNAPGGAPCPVPDDPDFTG